MSQKPKKRLTYAYKLAKLREIVDRFDAKKFDALEKKRPRTAAGKKARASELRKVSAAFARIRPYVHRVHTIVRVRHSAKAADRLEELRKYSGLPRFKGLRAIPLASTKAGKVRVKFDKNNRPTVKEGRAAHKFFRFSRMPNDGDDAIALLEKILPGLPQGYYFFATRHQFLIRSHYDRDQLGSGLRSMLYAYQTRAPDFHKFLYGVKWVSGSDSRVRKIKEAMRTERGRLSFARNQAKADRAAKQIAAMHKKLQGFQNLPRTERPELTREQNAKLKKFAQKFKPQKRPKLSKRARATGRR